MKFLICGLGSIGRRHLRNLEALGQREILLYRTHLSTLPDDELSAYPTFTDLYEALAEAPDGVIVANPTSLHMATSLLGAKAGANLLIEKPIADGLSGLSELSDTLKAHGRRALVGFHFRYHPVLQKIKEVLDSTAFGRPISARAHWGEYLPGWHPYEDYRKTYAARAELGGGVTLTLSHPIDYLRWMLGEVSSVSACLSKLSDLEINTEDNAELTLQFETGTLAQLHLDYYQRPASHTLSIACSEGRIHWDNSSGSATFYRADGMMAGEANLGEGYERNDLFLAEMRHFIDVCQGAEPLCSLEDGAAALKIALAAHQSSSEGCRRLELAGLNLLDGKIFRGSQNEEHAS